MLVAIPGTVPLLVSNLVPPQPVLVVAKEGHKECILIHPSLIIEWEPGGSEGGPLRVGTGAGANTVG